MTKNLIGLCLGSHCAVKDKLRSKLRVQKLERVVQFSLDSDGLFHDLGEHTVILATKKIIKNIIHRE